jgi:hypothetical protein
MATSMPKLGSATIYELVLAQLGSPQEMIYLVMDNCGRRHLFRVGRVEFVSQGRDYVDRVDGIDEGDDPVGGEKADRIPAAAVPGGDGDQVLPG